jgi:hypothetical protein
MTVLLKSFGIRLCLSLVVVLLLLELFFTCGGNVYQRSYLTVVQRDVGINEYFQHLEFVNLPLKCFVLRTTLRSPVVYRFVR